MTTTPTPQLTIREYLEARSALLQAYLSNPPVSAIYQVNKYARIPMRYGGDTVVVALRPKDVVETISIIRDSEPTITKMRFICSHNTSIADDKMSPSWKNERVVKWLSKNCTPIAHTDDHTIEDPDSDL